MTDSLNVLFGFLGGSIMSVEEGYKVLPNHPSERIFTRLADAKWFLALQWCEQSTTPAAILNNTAQFSFQNEFALNLALNTLIPEAQRAEIFQRSLPLTPRETTTVTLNPDQDRDRRLLEIQSVEIDPRYGKVALLRECLPDCVPTNLSF